MKKILLISLSLLFAGEMEVDGDLNVSGDIQSPTLDNLKMHVISHDISQIDIIPNGDFFTTNLDIPSNSLITSIDISFYSTIANNSSHRYKLRLEGSNLGTKYLGYRTVNYYRQYVNNNQYSNQRSVSLGWIDDSQTYAEKTMFNSNYAASTFFGDASPPIQLLDNSTTLTLSYEGGGEYATIQDFKIIIYYTPYIIDN